MNEQKLDCGCDCDTLSREQEVPVFLTREQVVQLIEDKIARIRKHREMTKRFDKQEKFL